MIEYDPRDIERWADQNVTSAFHRFPVLIRRLILATVPTTSFIDMPHGSAVWAAGWDGLLEVEEGKAWVPSGTSAWEFSVGGDPNAKAQENYSKRTTNPMGVDPCNATFIFVTPHVWKKKKEWAENRQEEGSWRQVHAFDATDLAAWLLEASGVADWFARLIGKLPEEGVVCLEDWWENWTGSTQPKISADLVLAGRVEVAEAITNWVAETESAFYVQGDVRDEAIAAMAASAWLTAGSLGSELLLARAVVVKTSEAWERLTHHPFPLILIRNFVEDVSSHVAVSRGHHVLIPLDSTQECHGNGRSLSRLGRDETADALVNMGLSDNEARSLFRKTARRLQVIRRFLLDEAGAPLPEWAAPTLGHSVVALVLLGQWDEGYEGDREIVSRLTDIPYPEVERELATFSNMADSPISKLGTRWRFVSHEEAWHILAPYLTSTDAKRFEEVAGQTLETTSPEFDLPVERRLSASLTGHTLRHSNILLKGLAQTLALMGVSNDRMRNVEDASYLPMRVLNRVFGDGSDWQTWATLAPNLSTLAEAAPSVFLDKVEGGIETSSSPIEQLFAQQGEPLFSSSPCVGLLWALERLAWSEEHFSRVAAILARLTKFEQAGQLMSSPLTSLSGLFHRWLRFTEAPDEHRLDALQSIMDRYPRAGWSTVVKNLSDRYLPERNLLNVTYWQPWGQGGYSEANRAEQAAFSKALYQLLKENVGTDVDRWSDVLNILADLTIGYRKDTIKLLDQAADTLKEDPNVETLRTAIRSTLDHHRSFPDARWAMDSTELDALDTAYGNLAQADPVAAYAWLFDSDWPDLPRGKGDEYEGTTGLILAARQHAINKIHNAGGVDALRLLIRGAKAPHSVGTAVAATVDADNVFDLALGFMGPNRTAENMFAMNFFMEAGWEVLDKALERVRLDGEFPPEAVADIHIAGSALDFKAALRRLDSEDAAVKAVYWNRIQYQSIARADLDERTFHSTVLQLLQVRRSLSASELIWRRSVTPELAIKTLEQLPKDLADQTEPAMVLDDYTLTRVFGRLDEDPGVPDEVIARLELPLFRTLRRHRPDLAFYRQVMQVPSLFADLVSLAYPRSDGQQEATMVGWSQEEQVMTFFDLLYGLHGLPGIPEDETTVDAPALNYWISEARRLCADRDRREAAEAQIGQVLSNAPLGTDGVWPCEPIRDLLESLPSRSDIADGFVIDRINQRGVASRGVFDGGTQERSLSDAYREDAKAIAAKWPFTASLLRRIADSYQGRAGQVDTRAHWRDESEP